MVALGVGLGSGMICVTAFDRVEIAATVPVPKFAENTVLFCAAATNTGLEPSGKLIVVTGLRFEVFGVPGGYSEIVSSNSLAMYNLVESGVRVACTGPTSVLTFTKIVSPETSIWLLLLG